jgi:cytochrome c-type biogenesis protein
MTRSSIDAKPAANYRFITLLNAIVFVLGFSLIFIVGWGGAVTLLGQLFGEYKRIIAQIGGLVVILIGVETLGVVCLPWLHYDFHLPWKVNWQGGFAASGLMGVFFAASWTPCLGVTLGAILTLGLSQQTVTQAMVLSSGYALGMAVPFLVIGLLMDRAVGFLRRFRRYWRPIEIFRGLFLTGIGVLILTGKMSLISIWAQRNGFSFDLTLGRGLTPTYLIAFLAGLISFFSPCVLPLVPAYISYLSGGLVDMALKPRPCGPLAPEAKASL